MRDCATLNFQFNDFVDYSQNKRHTGSSHINCSDVIFPLSEAQYCLASTKKHILAIHSKFLNHPDFINFRGPVHLQNLQYSNEPLSWAPNFHFPKLEYENHYELRLFTDLVDLKTVEANIYICLLKFEITNSSYYIYRGTFSYD